jgi:hypothetical protein
MDLAELHDLAARQDGVISRRQALATGATPNDIRRLLRRREWSAAIPGVYVTHTGPLTWTQRAWVAVLAFMPAALCHDSALRAVDGPGRRGRDDSGPIHVAVDRNRAVPVRREGIITHHLADLAGKVQWNSSPPRVRIEHAVLDVAAEARSDYEAIAVLADAVQARRTTAARLRVVLDERTRIARRSLLAGALDDIAQGTCSLLEHGYLNRVERPHGLPRGQRQVGSSSHGPIYRDVTYVRHGLVVELDGRLFHDSARARDRDLDRDLDAAVEGLAGIRLGWGQVFDRSCRTAVRVGELLRQRGWAGNIQRCPDCSPTNLAA